METTKYALRTSTRLSVEEAESKVREALSEQGFGVITEIDMSATLKAKIGKDIPPYKILGACRPPLAAEAVAAESDIGLLLPCNLVVYAEGDHTVVAALDPDTMVGFAGNPALDGVASDASQRIRAVIEAAATW